MKVAALVAVLCSGAKALTTCSTSGTRGSPPKPCPEGMTCHITNNGRPEIDLPNSGVCVTAESPKDTDYTKYNGDNAKVLAAFNAVDVDKNGKITYGGAYKALNSLFPKASEETLDSLTKKGDRTRDGMVDKSEFMGMYRTLLQQQQQQSGDICKTSNPCGDNETCRPCRNTKGYCCDAQAPPVGSPCSPTSRNQCPKGYSCLPVSQHLVTEEPQHADGHLQPPPQILDGLQPQHADGHLQPPPQILDGLMMPQVTTTQRYPRKLRGYGASSYQCQIRPDTCELCVQSKGNHWFGSHCIVAGEPQIMDAPMISSITGCRKKTAMDHAECSQYKHCDVCTSQAKDKTYGQLCAWSGTRCIQNQVSFWRPPITDPSMCDRDVISVNGRRI